MIGASRSRQFDAGQMIYMLLKTAQRRFGLARFEMGVLLCEVKDRELWKGRAASFAAFLEEERITASAAYLYMRVARKLAGELSLSDRDFEQIATVNMGTLDLATQVLTPDNYGEILDLLSILGERDAKQVLLERLDEEGPIGMSPEAEGPRQPRSRQVNRALTAFYDLPDDQRIEFLNALQRKNGNRNQEKAD